MTPIALAAAISFGLASRALTGILMTDGHAGYQHLLDRIAGIPAGCEHVIRRCSLTAMKAIRDAHDGKPWHPPLPTPS